MALKTRLGRIAGVRPDWSSPVEIEYNFKTSVLTAYDGTEQRSALRSTPRIQIAHRSVLTQAEASRHLADMASGQDTLFVVPARWRFAPISAIAGAAVTLDAVPFWAVAGATVVLSSATTEEVREIASVAGNVVTLTLAPSGSFAPGDRLIYAYQALANDAAGFEAQTDNLFTATLEWTADPARDPVPAAPVSPAQFEGRDLFTVRPNWRGRPTLEFNSLRRMFDPERGRVAWDSPQNYNAATLTMDVTRFGLLDAEEVIAFFVRQKGKRGAFYAPTWLSDIDAQPQSAGASTLVVPGLEFIDAYQDHPVWNVAYANGQANRITGMGISGGNTVLQFADPWAADLPEGTKVSWCPLWRFATDRLQVRWLTDTVAETRIALTTLANGGA